MQALIKLLQFEVIRTIAASLISVAIVLLWLVVISRQLVAGDSVSLVVGGLRRRKPNRFGATRRNTWVQRAFVFCAEADQTEDISMGLGRGMLLWLIGVPIPIIVLIAVLWHH